MEVNNSGCLSASGSTSDSDDYNFEMLFPLLEEQRETELAEAETPPRCGSGKTASSSVYP